ncbi:MAG: bifunctional 3-phenylpropionate/cinnamic acid dioxygenase ferredoxin subunit [Candidatus Dormiibacterota bacterium]|jgi:3-phenylpropionate/trans-cinnamate dioxygenase ferredoxin subunit
MPEWIRICDAEAIPPGHAARVEIGDLPIAVFNVNGQFHALDDTCSHAMASLSEGELHPAECAVECPLHGSQFDLRTGEPISLPAVEPVRVHEVAVRGGELWVALSEEEAWG